VKNVNRIKLTSLLIVAVTLASFLGKAKWLGFYEGF
jgi:hypothetical protein